MEAFGKNHQLNDITQKVIQYMQKQGSERDLPQFSEQKQVRFQQAHNQGL